MGEIGRVRIENALSWEHSRLHLLAAYERVFEKRTRNVTEVQPAPVLR
jgi:hypothetical protein